MTYIMIGIFGLFAILCTLGALVLLADGWRHCPDKDGKFILISLSALIFLVGLGYAYGVHHMIVHLTK